MQSILVDPGPPKQKQRASSAAPDVAPVVNSANGQTLLIGADELAGLLSVSIATLYRMKSAGKLPRPIPLSRGCVRWRRATIEAWLSECESAGRLLDRREWEALTQAKKGGR